ncbi:MAG: glucose-6-phosphate dehydrogenase, partial [Pseudomonadota bacterium]|nr:glucose-6-phosphate dehydrogenase [Pseudomonadota bacterium]
MTDSLQRSDLVLFGVLGDLSRRKLIPALFQLDRSGLLHQESKIIGVAREELSASQFEERVKDTLQTFVSNDELVDDVLERFCKRFHYVEMDFSQDEAYQALKASTS